MENAEPDPEKLMELARGGDEPALGVLLQSYRSYLALLASYQIGRRLQQKVDSSDVIQETFLEAYRDFKQFRGATEPELIAWLRRILANNLANVVERYHGTRRRDVRLERDLAKELDRSSCMLDRALADKQSSPSQRVARRDQAVILANALQRLSPDYRQVLIFRHLEELAFPEIAHRMKRSVPSVKNLWARAVAQLRYALGGVSS
jgi:RNA polymerase sigma-70 factor (ECF subfamily)